MNAESLKLPAGIKSGCHIFDGKIRECIAHDIARDDFIVHWDTIIDGARHNIIDRLAKDKNGEPFPVPEAKRAYALAEFEHIEQGIN